MFEMNRFVVPDIPTSFSYKGRQHDTVIRLIEGDGDDSIGGDRPQHDDKKRCPAGVNRRGV